MGVEGSSVRKRTLEVLDAISKVELVDGRPAAAKEEFRQAGEERGHPAWLNSRAVFGIPIGREVIPHVRPHGWRVQYDVSKTFSHRPLYWRRPFHTGRRTGPRNFSGFLRSLSELASASFRFRTDGTSGPKHDGAVQRLMVRRRSAGYSAERGSRMEG
jgi:hypothetical protein